MFIITCDLAKTSDFTAIGILELMGLKPYIYHLRYLKRPQRGTTYITISDYLKGLVSKVELSCNGHPPLLVLDGTGVGAAVEDILRRDGLQPISIKIHGGHNVTRKPGELHVPKKDLIITLLRVWNTGRLQIAAGIPEAETLKIELQKFKVRINPRTRRATYAGDGAHDDIVLSVSLGTYLGEKLL